MLVLGCGDEKSEPKYFDRDILCASGAIESCHGSPENPFCISWIEFRSDGRAYKSYDDIIVEGTYAIYRNEIIVIIHSNKDISIYTVLGEGFCLLEDNGSITFECEYRD